MAESRRPKDLRPLRLEPERRPPDRRLALAFAAVLLLGVVVALLLAL